MNSYFVYNTTIEVVHGPYSFKNAWNLKRRYDSSGDISAILKMVVDWKGNLVKDDKKA